MALMFALLVAVPTGAYAQADNGQDDSVTVTFQLTLYGDVPATQFFWAEYGPLQSVEFIDLVEFCGFDNLAATSMNVIDDDARLPCKGNGTVYTKTRTLPSRIRLSFAFIRQDTGSSGLSRYFRGSQPLDDDIMIRARYTYGGAGMGGDRHGGDVVVTHAHQDHHNQLPTGMPHSGGGGMAGGELPLGSFAAAASLLLARAYALLRRRQPQLAR